jgi:hypothetical protein
MSLLERISAETRRRTGWVVPVGVGVLVSGIAPDSGELIERTAQLWYGGLGLAGVLAGVLWQWFSPRPLADRLFIAAAGFVLLCAFLLLPLGGEWRQDRYGLYFCLGAIAGLVLASWWQRVRAD